jgi:hypothetical protein
MLKAQMARACAMGIIGPAAISAQYKDNNASRVPEKTNG